MRLTRGSSSRAARWSRAPLAIPASGSRWSATRLGLKTVIVIPETQSDEKKHMLRLAGAELIEVPAVPYKDPNNYVKYSGRLAEEFGRV